MFLSLTRTTVSVTCQREGSTVTAGKYNQTIAAGGKYHEYGALADVGTLTPEKLNFFFQIEIEMQHADQTAFEFANKVWMGQGHTGLRNNWWIGGMNMVNLGNGSVQFLQLTAPQSGQPIFIPMVEGIIGVTSDGASTFNFSLYS